MRESRGQKEYSVITTFGKITMRKTYVNALVSDKGNLNIDPIVRRSLLTFYKRNLYIDNVKDNPIDSIIESTENECLIKAANSNFDFLIMTWEGNIFDIHRYHRECIESIDAIDSETNGQWLVTGHLMDQEQNRLFHNDPNSSNWVNSFWLFPITAIINIKKWVELGMPNWGQEDGMINVKKAIPSKECVHDNYTPLLLNAGIGESVTKVKKGWSIINASLQANLPIRNLPTNIRNVQNYLYPENDITMFNNFWTSLYNMPKLNGQYKKVMETLLISKYPRRIKDSAWQYFIKNTEDYTPGEGFKEVDWTNINTVILPSSGFKDFIISMGVKGPRKKIDTIHFDIISECVDIRKSIIQEWDGKRSSFEPLLLSIGKRYRNNPIDIYHMHSMENLEEAYDHMLLYFKDEQDLEEQWIKYKSFDHSYIETDMLSDPYNAVKLIKNNNIYICLSDIAGWRNNIMGYGYVNLRNSIINCLLIIKNKKLDGVLDYKDPGTDLQFWQSFDEAINYLEQPL
jgi:hypothetical protein